MPGPRVATRRVTSRRVATGLAALMMAGLLVVPAAHAAAPPSQDDREPALAIGHYAALGDSFAAGPFILPQDPRPPGCARSTRNYPALLAASLNVAEFTDVTCSMARIDHMTSAQSVPLGSNPPQFDALRPDTDLVTVTISGNDIGFTNIIVTCGRLSVTDPQGEPCRQAATTDGTDIYHQRIAAAEPKLAAVLSGIRERSPDALVVLVGYLRILPPQGGCWPLVPIARGDVAYLDGVQQQLNAMMARQAAAHGALFVDAYAHSLGHDICQPPGVRWVEGMLPTSVTWPAHPNVLGMRAAADFTLAELTGAVGSSPPGGTEAWLTGEVDMLGYLVKWLADGP